ncbi:Lrp/AsnC family transcriptional regulator [Saccharopolyspora griseoalba]|uniref:Lrp/AsnC family transcriptional regulator n=1 Tax=Saccharopolyspora griseoalba TaxID=1431848 RepID=A0ABW2LQK3_9PSEU
MGAELARQVAVRFDELDRRIVGALQVDGRASWHRIAHVLGEQERTVTRRGTQLIRSGLVRITGLTLRAEGVIVGLRCAPGQARLAGGALARRDDAMFTHVLTGSTDCIAEISCPSEHLASLVMDELPATPGMVESFTQPVLRYIRTAHEWHPGLITDDERAALEESAPLPRQRHFGDTEDLPKQDKLLVAALAEDARRTYEELARLTGLSEATVRRHLDRLRRDGRVLIRAVVEPAQVGLPIEAMLWVRTSPADVDDAAEGLRESPYVRYASRLCGDWQFLINATLPTPKALDDFVSRAPWAKRVQHVETSMVLCTLKRSGVLAPPSSGR